MDPNAALDNILTGFMIADHAEALQEWLAKEGFAPAERTLPERDGCATFVREHVEKHHHRAEDFTTIDVRADRNGLWTRHGGQWISLVIWPDLLKMV